jgi:hypothetical protein
LVSSARASARMLSFENGYSIDSTDYYI